MIQRGLLDDLVRNSVQDLIRGSLARMSGDKSAGKENNPFKAIFQAPPANNNPMASILAQSKKGPAALNNSIIHK